MPPRLRATARDLAVALLRVVVLGALVLVALGPALGPFARALGATDEHACACGMKPGTCGCAACARMLHQDEPATPRLVAVLGSCDDHGPASLSAPLPIALVPEGIRVAPSPRAGDLPAASPPGSPPSLGDPPPTPPPRLFTV